MREVIVYEWRDLHFLEGKYFLRIYSYFLQRSMMNVVCRMMSDNIGCIHIIGHQQHGKKKSMTRHSLDSIPMADEEDETTGTWYLVPNLPVYVLNIWKNSYSIHVMIMIVRSSIQFPTNT